MHTHTHTLTHSHYISQFQQFVLFSTQTILSEFSIVKKVKKYHSFNVVKTMFGQMTGAEKTGKNLLIVVVNCMKQGKTTTYNR